MTIPQPTILGTKRKRAPVSYVDNNDDEIDVLLSEDKRENAIRSEDDPDAYGNDMSATFGSKKKPPKLHATKKFKQTRKKSFNNIKPFPFMELPPEIRDLIYEFALTDSTDTAIAAHVQNKRRIAARPSKRMRMRTEWKRSGKCKLKKPKTKDRAPCVLVPALLAVSKQLHKEAVGFLYQSPLIFKDPHALHSFLAGIGSHRAYVRDVLLQQWGYGRGTKNAMNYAAFPLLGLCTNLNSLTIQKGIGLRTQPEKIAELVYRNTHFFLEAYGMAKGRKDAAVDVIVLDAPSYFLYPDTECLSKEERRERFRIALRKLLLK
ncbi:hypothetical protein KC318_g14351 [Hortaea werneckii]|nr:hypothetical protein KC334_g8011 [Hortaea werneckii]KAI7006156.1 hypothetical protein KC355_g7883 [Hortaea werneckii]KAI7653295.1 hypothetical protein KC318_g14351 [Hortaea werneckii]RMY11446.1 hypothetical protein D0867_08079 [Hortaea werneckii]